MSLLLEALKKAERAKEEAQRRARGESANPGGVADASPPERKNVVTRDKLPKITAPLEIATEDLAPAALSSRPPLEIAPDPEPAKAGAPRAQPTQPAAPATASVAPSSGIPGLPATSPKSAAPEPTPAPAAPAPRASVEPQVETPRLRPLEPRRIAQALPALPQTAATVSRNPPQVHPKVAAGYAAYAAGDLTGARRAHGEALRD